MQDVQFILSGLWVSLMLSYLLGDVLRIFAGDFKPGEMEGKKMNQNKQKPLLCGKTLMGYVQGFSCTLGKTKNLTWFSAKN